MAKQEKVYGISVWTIDAGDGMTRATFVPELGAIGSSLIMPGHEGPRETLFQHDYFWDPDTEMTRGGLPFLFPVCGRLERGGSTGRYLYDGCPYTLKIHGFAHRLPWQVVAADEPAVLELALTDTEGTLANYPFGFEVRLKYRIEPGLLVCEQQYTNRGDSPLPYYAGFHPYFLTPPPGAGKSCVSLNLEPNRLLAYNDQRTDVVGDKQHPPAFPIAITDPGIHEQLIRLGTDKTAYLSFPDDFQLHLQTGSSDDPDMFPYIQLYTMPDKPFFCVEPWMGVPNSLNTVSGVRWLQPQQSESAYLRIGAGVKGQSSEVCSDI